MFWKQQPDTQIANPLLKLLLSPSHRRFTTVVYPPSYGWVLVSPWDTGWLYDRLASRHPIPHCVLKMRGGD